MEIHEAIKVCIDNGITIYPVIQNKTHLIIEINFKGRKKKGKELYNAINDQKKLQKKARDLYIELATRIQSKKQDVHA
tara:strand:- start:3168 stop:3401 length:234 start_codon:yes stop_codon:yes gene_type:complete